LNKTGDKTGDGSMSLQLFILSHMGLQLWDYFFALHLCPSPRNRIRELRKQMDMTQKELAIHLQIADSTLSYWEMGKYEPDNDALFKLSRFFQVPIDYILGGDFTRWDINGSRMPSTDVDTLRLADSGISVSEPIAAYGINCKNVNSVESSAVDGHLSASVGSLIPDTSQPATSPNTACGSPSAQAAFNRIEFEDLTQEEIDLLAEFALFIKSRRKHGRTMSHTDR